MRGAGRTELLVLALARLLGVLEERLAEGGVAVKPPSRLPERLAALAQRRLGEKLADLGGEGDQSGGSGVGRGG